MSSTEQPMPATTSDPPVNISSPATGSESVTALSKSAQKRLAKAERFTQLKLEKRAREKEQKVAKRKEREERIAAGEDPGPSNAKKRRVSRGGEGPVRPFNARIVIDLGFDEKMTEKEVGSLCSQLAYTYAAHRRTRTPFGSLLFTGLSGRSQKLLDSTNDASYRRWKYTEWWDEDIDGLWNPPPTTQQPLEEPPQSAGEPVETPDIQPAQAPTEPEPIVTPEPELTVGSEPTATNPEAAPPVIPSARLKQRRAPKADSTSQVRSACPRESVVYLSADAEDEILELKEGETYVIGGIVDRNRYKNLCANKARDLNVRSARLPIGRYLADMPTRKVLTVNQVFDILVYWVTTRNWEEAMQKVMPKRKFNANGRKGKRSQAQVGEDDDEGAGDEDDDPTQPDEEEPTKPDDEGTSALGKEESEATTGN